MHKRRAGAKAQPFPLRRPEISIKPSRARSFTVDYREVFGWFAVPEVGDRTMWCIYDPPDWRLTSVTDTRSVRPAQVHGLECVEMELDDWNPNEGWKLRTWMMFARLGRERGQYVANMRVVDGKRRLYTFLDEGFDEDWGDWPRKLQDTGRLASRPDGSYRVKAARGPGPDQTLAAGIFRVKVGDRSFTCLRGLGFAREPSEWDTLYEFYVTRRGRTILGRRYNGRLWHTKPGDAWADKPWDERFPDHNRIVINGVTYVHWYDCLSHLACGIDPQARAG